MTVADIEEIMETWAPRWTAWERDNVGLQVGDPRARVRRILVCLDVTPEVIEEARRTRTDLIISHHPLLFHPLTSLTPSTAAGAAALELARHGIALYSAHKIGRAHV